MTTFCDGKIDNKDEGYMTAVVVVVVVLLTSLLLSIVEMAGGEGLVAE